MWQITWMLGLLPDWFWHVITIGGLVALVAAWFLKRIPFISQYNLPLKAIGIVALLLGVWMEGGIANEAKWQAKVADMEARLKLAEEAANNKTVEIQEKIVTKTKVIKEKGKTQIEYVDRVITQDKEVIKYIEQCPVPKVIIDEHNKAATPPEVIRELNKAAEVKK